MLTSLTPNARGMLCLTVAVAVFTCSDVLLKLSAQSWPVSQVMVYRGAVATTLCLIVIAVTGQLGRLRLLSNPLVAARGGCEGALAVLFILALSKMPLADLTAIMMMSPLLIAAMAALLFGEQVGWRRWGAILGGLAGMLMVLQPGRGVQPDGYGFAAMLGVGSVIGVAARDLITRRIREDVPSIVITLATTVSATAGGAILSLFETWSAWWGDPLIFLAFAALFVTGANHLMVVAHRGVDLSVVAPFRYSAVLFAVPMSILVFGDLPNGLAVLGMAVIVASGVYLMHRERIRRLPPRQFGGPP
jgi:drug/metabolite transporter (DMT)-like permease